MKSNYPASPSTTGQREPRLQTLAPSRQVQSNEGAGVGRKEKHVACKPCRQAKVAKQTPGWRSNLTTSDSVLYSLNSYAAMVRNQGLAQGAVG